MTHPFHHLEQRLRETGWTILSPRKREGEKSGILLTTRPGLDVDKLGQRLNEEGFVVSLRGGALRVAPHAYNTAEELDRLVAVL